MIGGPENIFKYEVEEIICLLILQLIWSIVHSILRFSCEKIGGPPYRPCEKLSGPPFEACEKIGGPPWKSSGPPVPPIFNEHSLRECPFESVGGGQKTRGGHANSVLDLGGGASKFRIGFRGGGGSCKVRIRGKKPVTLHFRIIIYLLKII